MQLSKYTSLANDWFPEIFKKELVVGKWYKRDGAIFEAITKPDSNGKFEVRGFDIFGTWMEDEKGCYTFCTGTEEEATPQEVEAALIGEAKKRGYRDGDFVTPLWETPYTKWSLIGNNFRFENGKLYLSSCIFKDGIWATIIPDETFTKPLLSLNDLLSVWSEDNDTEFYKTSRLFKSFEKLAKSKI